MARCPICGRNYADTVRVCSTCGARLAGSNASSTHERIPVQGNGYQQPAAQMPPVQRKPIKQNAGVFNIIFSAIVPLYGIIMYFSWKKTRPKAAKQVLIAALIALALALITQIPTVSRPNTNTLMSSPAPTIPTYSISSPSPNLSPVTPSSTPSPSSDTPKLAAGDQVAFDQFLDDVGLALAPSFSNSACYVTRLSSGLIHCMEYVYEGDTVVIMEELVACNMDNYTDEGIQSLKDLYQELADSAKTLSCASVQTSYSDNWFFFQSTIRDLDSPENIAAAKRAGLLEVEDGTQQISISITEEYLLSEGYLKR